SDLVALPLLVLRFLDVPDAQPRVTMVAGALAIVATPITVMLARVRRLVRAGFGHRDLTEALRAELFHRREELAFLYGEGPSRLARVARRMCYLPLAVPDPGQPPGGFLEQVLRLAEGESHQPPPQLGAAKEARSRNGRDADLPGEPHGELVVGQRRDAREVGQHVVRALRRRAAEPRVHECTA